MRLTAILAACAMLLGATLAFQGCRKDDAPESAPALDEAAEPIEEEAAEEPAEAAPAEAAQAPTAEVPVPPIPQAVPAEDLADLPIKDEDIEQMVEYISSMTAILEEHAEAPKVAAEKLDEYLKANYGSLQELRDRMQESQEGLTQQQQQVLGQQMMAKMGPVIARMQQLFAAHPNLATDPDVERVMKQFK